MQQASVPYRNLCTQYYELDKPIISSDALTHYLECAKEAQGPILEPMCGTGRFLLPMLERGYIVTGFDYSPYMLDVCRKKSKELGLNPELVEATFETFIPRSKYNLIFIPSGSFCLLTDQKQILQALKFISSWLAPKGKFIFEVETLKSIETQQGVWKGSWVSKPNGSLIVLNTLSKFDETSQIKTILCRYELWERNAISLVEVENFQLRLYEPSEIESLLYQSGFKVLAKWQAEPHKKEKVGVDASVIVYECEQSL